MAKRKPARRMKTAKARASRIDARRWAGVPAPHHDTAAPAHDARMLQMPVGDRDDLRDGVAEARLKAEAEDLGPIVLPSAEDAYRVLRELAELYHERFDAQRRHDQLKQELKQASEEIAGLTSRIAERIRVATHRTGLPLFAEADDALEA